MTAPLFLHISVSLDGRIADGDGKLDWMGNDPDFHRHIAAMLGGISGMVFGRTAHTELAAFWPDAAKSDDPAIRAEAEPMNRLPKYVLTHGELAKPWANSRAVSLDQLTQLRSKASAPIAVFAGAATAQAVLEAGLLDEIVLLRHPVLLGDGKLLFGSGGRRDLQLNEVRAFESGIAVERYTLRGDARKG